LIALHDSRLSLNRRIGGHEAVSVLGFSKKKNRLTSFARSSGLRDIVLFVSKRISLDLSLLFKDDKRLSCGLGKRPDPKGVW
jgi:hypothetical protein